MAARRRNGRRQRRGRYGFLYKLLSFLIIFTAILVGCVVFFRVNEVTVEGNRRYTAQEIIDASAVELGDNLLLVNKHQTVRNINRRLPYIETVSPVRRLPDVLELRVTETVAAARLRTGEGWWLINADGKLVELAEPGVGEGLPQVSGLTPLEPRLGARMTVELADQPKLDGLKALLTALEEKGMADQIGSFIDLHANSVIRFAYGEELTVTVPVTADFQGVVHRLQRTLDTLESMGTPAVGTLDMTYGDGQAHLLPDQWLPEELRPVQPTVTPTPEPTEQPGGEGE